MRDRPTVIGLCLVIAFGGGWLARAFVVGGRDVPPLPAPPPPPAPAPSASVATPEAVERVFSEIYTDAKWGTNDGDAGTSGRGSTLASTKLYRAFLEHLMKDAEIHTVVDAGCGDWEFSHAIDFQGVDYKGFDIVPSVIEADRKKYEAANVHFFVADVVTSDLPRADLLIVKHVLQHLPNAMVQAFLAKQLPKYKHTLLVDSVSATTMSSKNPDIAIGGFRDLDPTRAPFNVLGAKVLTYWDGWNMQQVVYVRGPTPDGGR